MSIAFDSAWGVLSKREVESHSQLPLDMVRDLEFPLDNLKRDAGEEIPGRKNWLKPQMLARIKNLAGFDADSKYGERLTRIGRRQMDYGKEDEYQPGTGISADNWDTILHHNEIEGILEELNRRAARKGKEFVPDKETQRFLDHIASIDPRVLGEDEDYYQAISRLAGSGDREDDSGAGAGYYRKVGTFKDDPEHVYKVPKGTQGSRAPGEEVFDNAISMALERMGYPFIGERPVKGRSRADSMLVRQPRAFAVGDFPHDMRREMGAITHPNAQSHGTLSVPSLVDESGSRAARYIRDYLEDAELEAGGEGLEGHRLAGLRHLLPRVDEHNTEEGQIEREGTDKIQNERLSNLISRFQLSGIDRGDKQSAKKVPSGLNRPQNITQIMQADDLHGQNLGVKDGKLQIIDPMYSGMTGKNFLTVEPERKKKLGIVGDTREVSAGKMGRGGLSGLLNMLYGSHGEQMMEAARGLEDSKLGYREGWNPNQPGSFFEDEGREEKLSNRELEALMHRMRSPAMRYRQILEQALPYLEENVRDELPDFAEGLPDRQFYQPWFDTLLEAMDKKRAEKEALEGLSEDQMFGDDGGRSYTDDRNENEEEMERIARQMRKLGGHVDSALEYKRFLQLLANMKEDPEQMRMFEFANPTSAKFGEVIREAATRPEVSMESALEQIDHEPLPRIGSGIPGGMATVVGADNMKRLYDEAMASIRAKRGDLAEGMNEPYGEGRQKPLSERAPEAFEEQAKPRVTERMVVIYNLLSNQYGEEVAQRWWDKYGGGSFIESLGAEGYKAHKLVDEENRDSRYGTGEVQDYGGLLASHPAWQAADEFLEHKKELEGKVPDLEDIQASQERVGGQALEDMMANVDDMPPEWQEKFKQMSGISQRAGDIARGQRYQGESNAETEALREFYKVYGREAAQDMFDSWLAGGEMPFDATGKLISNQAAVENAQMLSPIPWLDQEMNNINWPPGVGMA